VGGQRHANAAPDEIKEIADEFREIMHRAGLPTPASDVLFREVDKRFQAVSEPPSAAATAANQGHGS
jgi:hypothetical protein